MKKANVLLISNFLSNIKLNKFDKETRSAIIRNSLAVSKISKEIEDSVQEARKRLSEGIEDEITKLAEYRERFKTASEEDRLILIHDATNNCPRAISFEKELNDFVNALGQEEVDITFIVVDKDTFVDQCADADIDITPAMIELFNEMFN